MSATTLAALSNIRIEEDMIVIFRNEEQCRRLLESIPVLLHLTRRELKEVNLERRYLDNSHRSVTSCPTTLYGPFD
jgi:hypothetical protein